MLDSRRRSDGSAIAIVVKGYPRLSETFIAQEILALERAGLELEIWSLRHPTDGAMHALNRAIQAKAFYLPEYLYQEPLRVLRGIAHAMRRRGFGRMLVLFWRDLRRDATPNRLRRFGQACVFARELPDRIRHLHVHYLHTPASVARYAALLSGRGFSISAHAKDIFTIPAWEKREKVADARFLVTCTRAGLMQLQADCAPQDHGRLQLLYHGLDLSRFPPPPLARPARRGDDPDDPVIVLSVGRAVAKKGYDDLLAALAALPRERAWLFRHVGGGAEVGRLKALAQRIGIAERCTFLGAQAQDRVLAEMAAADLFALACKAAPDGDRDGLPNVLMEAATQALALVSTDFAGVPEFVSHDVEGLLVPPGDVAALTAALDRLIAAPELRTRLGAAARAAVTSRFSFEAGIAHLADRLRAELAGAAR